MKYIIIRTIAVLITSYLTSVGVPLVFSSLATSLYTLGVAVTVAIVLAIINHTIKPVFMIVSIPINVVTLGLFSFVINGTMILLASKIVPAFSVSSLLLGILFSLVLTLVNWVLHIFE